MKKLLQLLITGVLSFPVSVTIYAQSWAPVSPGYFPVNVSGQIHGISRVSDFKFHPTLATKRYAVSARGGLFISTNSGTTWTMAPGCDAMNNGLRFASVCIDINNDQIIYLGTGDLNYYSTGSGVYKSTNGGTTFSASNTGISGRLIAEIIMDPTNSNVLVAATDAGIYKSTNAGSTWTLKTSSSLQCTQMLRKANASSRVLFVSTRIAFYLSNDFGDTWVQTTAGLYTPAGYASPAGIRIATTPADSNKVYLAMVAHKGTIFSSADGGLSFNVIKDANSPNLTNYTNDSTTDGGQGDYNYMLAADPVNPATVYLGAHAFWKSTNGGAAWSQLTNWWAVLHTDMHWVRVNPYNTNEIWTANDGGVWMSTNGGSNWTPKSDGLYGYEIYHGITSPTRRDMISIGTQDNGELYYADTTWYCNRGGDWTSVCTFDYRPNSNMVYYHGNANRRNVNGGQSTYGLTQTSFNDIGFYRNNTNLAMVADTAVYRTANLLATTPTWTKISSFNKTIRAVHVNVNDSSKVYAITSDSAIHIGSGAYDASPTFTRKVVHNTTVSTGSIATIKGNASIIYAVMGNKVYRSGDGGNTWANISLNLPSVNWVGIVADEFFASDELVFVAGANYVYYKKAANASWTLYNTALPVRTNIQDISLFDDGTNQSVLRVTEYGRGVWELPISQLRDLLANFNVSSTTPCSGTSVQFSDMSNGVITSRMWTFTGGVPASSTLANPVVTYTASGVYDVSLTVGNGVANNTATRTAYINTLGGNLNVQEGFEAGFPPTGWSNIDVNNDQQKWGLNSSVGGFGTSTSCVWFDNYDWDVAGRKDEFRTSRLDLAGYTSSQLKFDVAYQPYGNPYLDTLQILISTDCGNTFTQIFLKGGSTLATVAGNNSSPFIPTASQWRTETVNLAPYLGGSVIVAFRNLGHFGNNLYIDNIAITGTITAQAGADKNICRGSSIGIGSSPDINYLYSWSPAAGLSSTSVSNPVASPLINTQYILTVTHARSGILNRDTMQVNVDSVTFAASITHVLCNGASTGIINQTMLSGIAPFTYAWSNGTTNQNAGSLAAGSYTVIITDNQICSKSYTYSVSEPAAIVPSITTTPTTCGAANGGAAATASGGISPYSYVWNNGNTSASITSLAAATYTVIVTDSNLCTQSTTAVVAASLPVLPNGTQKNLQCFGGKTGWCKVSPSQGVAPYTYLWSTGATLDSIGNRTAGSYTCTITASSGCTAVANFTLTQPPQIQIAMSGTPATAPLFNNGSATATPSNGVSPYRYTWNTSPARTTQTITDLVAGTYVVTVKDNKKCARSASIIINTARLGLQEDGETTTVMPNPASDMLQIEYYFHVPMGNVKFVLTDNNGQTVYETTRILTRESGIETIQLGDMANGNYLLYISYGDNTEKVHKIIVAH